MGGVGSMSAWVRVCVGQILALVAWVACLHKILAWVTRVAWVAWVKKKGVSSVGRNFGMGRVCLRCFVRKALLKISQNLQESSCAGVSC